MGVSLITADIKRCCRSWVWVQHHFFHRSHYEKMGEDESWPFKNLVQMRLFGEEYSAFVLSEHLKLHRVTSKQNPSPWTDKMSNRRHRKEISNAEKYRKQSSKFCPGMSSWCHKHVPGQAIVSCVDAIVNEDVLSILSWLLSKHLVL